MGIFDRKRQPAAFTQKSNNSVIDRESNNGGRMIDRRCLKLTE